MISSNPYTVELFQPVDAVKMSHLFPGWFDEDGLTPLPNC